MEGWFVNKNEVLVKSTILFSARLNTSTETHNLRDKSIDNIVERSLLIFYDERGLTVNDLFGKKAMCMSDGMPILRMSELEASLLRLKESGRIEVLTQFGKNKYKLKSHVFEELKAVELTAKTAIKGIIKEIFDESDNGYFNAFLDCLSRFFCKIGELNVKIIQGYDGEDKNIKENLNEAIDFTTKKNKQINKELFRKGMLLFFNTNDPDYNQLKWNLAQNYYIAKSLGLDKTGNILSFEVFGNSTIVLDTNIIIQMLDDKAKHYLKLDSLFRLCRSNNIKILVFDCSIFELNRVVEYQKTQLERFSGLLPQEIVKDVEGDIPKVYAEYLDENPKISLEDALANYLNPAKNLKLKYEIEINRLESAHVNWNSPDINAEINKIREFFKQKRNKEKSESSAKHDFFVVEEIKKMFSTGRKAWLLTLDTTLPKYQNFKMENGKPYAITLDSFLQWFSPFASSDQYDDFADVFSEVIVNELMPRVKFFNLKDLVMFAEIEGECKELPLGDIENCITEIKKVMPEYDPTKAEDREKITGIIRSFFSDPNRIYRKNIVNITREKERIKSSMQAEISVLQNKLNATESEIEQKEKKFDEILKSEKEAATKEKNDRLKLEAYLHIGLILVVAIIFDLIVIITFGNGTNFFQKMESLAASIGIIFFIFFFLSLLTLTPEKRELLNVSIIDKLFRS